MNEKKRRLFLLIGVLLVLAGVAVRAYPTVSNWYREYTARYEIKDYCDIVDVENKDSLTKMKNMATKYNQELEEEGGDVSAVSYDDLLAVTDAIGFLEIPKLQVYLPIYHGAGEDVLEKGIGHMPGTSLPVGGASTHCVLSGHTGLPSAKMFTHLDDLEEGDMFYIHVLDEVLAYQVDQKKVVLPDETEDIEIIDGKDYVTLLTCFPYGVNSHRLLVRGERTSNVPSELSVQMPVEQNNQEMMAPRTELIIAGVCVGLFCIFLIWLVCRITRGKKKDADVREEEEK